VVFVRNTVSNRTYAIKIFQKTLKGRKEYGHEIEALELVSDSLYVLKHSERCDFGEAPRIPYSFPLRG